MRPPSRILGERVTSGRLGHHKMWDYYKVVRGLLGFRSRTATIFVAACCLLQTSCSAAQPDGPDAAIVPCLHPAGSAPAVSLPPADPTGVFAGALYVRPCPALVPQAASRDWDVAVVGPDDRTLSVYFTGGLLTSRCALLQRVDVMDSTNDVAISLHLGMDPALARQKTVSCDTVGRLYVTNVVLATSLSSRHLSVPVGALVVHR